MRTVLLAILLTCTILPGCTKRRPTIGTPSSFAASHSLAEGAVIKSGGTWMHGNSAGSVQHILTITPSGTKISWNYTITDRSGNGGLSSAIPLASPSAPWFIYAESPRRLWFFDGSGSLTYRDWDEDNGSNPTDAITSGTLTKDPVDIPSGLIPHLPADLQKLFPATTAEPRPSI